MAYTYVMSDIHGHYEEYLKMLEKIDLQADDQLYIIGDIIDRGPHPVRILLDVMNRPNVVCLAGNHCLMACECLEFLMQEITDLSIKDLSADFLNALLNWQANGAKTTLDEFRALDKEQQKDVFDFISDLDVYEELTVGDKEYLLVHAGLDNFSKDRELWDYEISELVWTRPDYNEKYFDDKIVITGHTPTLAIDSELNTRPGYIFQANNHIVVDCGCGIEGGRLGCLRLEDMKEFYV